MNKLFSTNRLTYPLSILLTISLLIHLVLAILPPFKIDIDSFAAWSIRLFQLGLDKFYSKEIFTDYTPGYLYLLYLLGLIKSLINLNTEQFYFLLKLPPIIAEVMLGLILFLEAYHYRLKLSNVILISSLILFNLGLIFDSSIWGQIDSLLTLLMVLSIYFLKTERYLLSSLSLGTAFLIKPQAIAIIPIWLLFIVRNRFFKDHLSQLLLLTLPAVIIVLVLSIPFFPSQPLTGLFNRVLETAKEYPYTSLFALNFWGIVGTWIKDEQLGILNLTFSTWGYILLTSYWILLIFLYLKHRLSLYTLAALATLAFYFLPTRVHERYLYPALVFLVFSALELRSNFLLVTQIILSIFYLASLYQVYVYYNYLYPHLPISFPIFSQTFYQFLESNSKLLSVVLTSIFIIITIWIIKFSHVKKII